MSLHGVKVYVIARRVCDGICVGSRSHCEGEKARARAQEEGGRNGFDEHHQEIMKQNIKAREAQNHNRFARTTPSHLSSLVENKDAEDL